MFVLSARVISKESGIGRREKPGAGFARCPRLDVGDRNRQIDLGDSLYDTIGRAAVSA